MSVQMITIRGKKNRFTQTIEKRIWDEVFVVKKLDKYYEIISTEVISTNTFIPKEVREMLPKAKPVKSDSTEKKEK